MLWHALHSPCEIAPCEVEPTVRPSIDSMVRPLEAAIGLLWHSRHTAFCECSSIEVLFEPCASWHFTHETSLRTPLCDLCVSFWLSAASAWQLPHDSRVDAANSLGFAAPCGAWQAVQPPSSVRCVWEACAACVAICW